MNPRISVLLVLTAGLTLDPLPAAEPLVAKSPVELTGTHGRFDFIKFDAARGRLLACHTGNGSRDVIDAATSKLIKSVPTGVAIDAKGGSYDVSVSKPPQMVMVDAARLEVVATVPLPDPADVDTFGATWDRVFVCDDAKPELWMIDPVAKKIAATLTLPGVGMEDLGFNDAGTFLFQCMKKSSELAKIDPRGPTVVAHWSTAPAENPHGMAMVPGSETVLIAGGTGQLALMSLVTGQVLASTDIAPRVDEIAYDPGLKRVYGASGTGVISVVQLDGTHLSTLATVPSAPGAHSITVDPVSHSVWIAFATKDGRPCVQEFSAQ
jgi:DNA-binding beta-propeller fold protein YncE